MQGMIIQEGQVSWASQRIDPAGRTVCHKHHTNNARNHKITDGWGPDEQCLAGFVNDVWSELKLRHHFVAGQA